MKRKVISQKILPSRFPIWQSVILFLLFDRLAVPQWVWASVGTLWGLFFLASIVLLFNEEQIDIFKNKSEVK